MLYNVTLQSQDQIQDQETQYKEIFFEADNLTDLDNIINDYCQMDFDILRITPIVEQLVVLKKG